MRVKFPVLDLRDKELFLEVREKKLRITIIDHGASASAVFSLPHIPQLITVFTMMSTGLSNKESVGGEEGYLVVELGKGKWILRVGDGMGGDRRAVTINRRDLLTIKHAVDLASSIMIGGVE